MRSISIICLAFVFAFFSCEGPIGPPGRDGVDGLDGEDGLDGLIGFTFDYVDINFTEEDNYEVYLSLPNDFSLLEGEVALVYLLWEEAEIDGEIVPIWRQLPNTVFTEFGMMQYNFDFTPVDIRLFIDADFDRSQLGAGDLYNQYFRVVVVPADFYNGRTAPIDFSNYYEVIEHFGIEDKPLSSEAVIMERP